MSFKNPGYQVYLYRICNKTLIYQTIYRIVSNIMCAYVIRREGTKARPNGPDLRSGFAGIQGFESLPSHKYFLYFNLIYQDDELFP